jgi:hypothetical protein
MYTSSILDSLRLQEEEKINNIIYDLNDSRSFSQQMIASI